MRGFDDAEPREAEIRDFGPEIVVQKNVAGLDISVVYRRRDGGVEVSYGLSRFRGDVEANEPREPLASLALQVLRERAVGHELIDEDLLAEVDGAAEEADEVGVADGRDEPDLVDDLLDAVGVAVADSLDGEPLVVGVELPGVDGSVGANA